MYIITVMNFRDLTAQLQATCLIIILLALIAARNEPYSLTTELEHLCKSVALLVQNLASLLDVGDYKN